MQILDPRLIDLDRQLLDSIENEAKSIFRAITFCKKTSSKSLLDEFINATNSLTEILSIKNAQMEATTEQEVELYHRSLNKVIIFIINEIKNHVPFEDEIQLFQIFRIVSPESHQRHPNQFRNQLVQIGNFLCPDPKYINGLVSQVFEQMASISNPIVRAIYLHHELIRIHPFVDGNGRTVRIAKNWILMHNLYPPIFIKDSAEKKEYIRSLSNSFRAIERDNSIWNAETADFFLQELERISFSTNYILEKISR